MVIETQKEQRLYPRHVVDLMVQLNIACSTSDAEFKAAAINLSQNGIQISCNSEVVSALSEQPEYPPPCGLSFLIPGSQYLFSSRCRLVVNRRFAQNDYRLGFMFISFMEQSEQRLIDYLTAHQIELS